MYKLLMFLSLTQIVLGIAFVLAGAAVIGVNRIVGEHDNHITRRGRQLGFVGLWLLLIGVVAVLTVFIASVPVRQA
jgi:hypothetical protein